MMNSGSNSPAYALSHKPSSAAHSSRPHSARSPRRISSPLSKSSPTSSPRRSRESAATRNNQLENGSQAINTNGHIDSDAETIILSADDEKNKPKSRAKKMNSDNIRNTSSPPLTSKLDPSRSVPSSRRSSINGATSDKKTRRTNGADKGESTGDLTSNSLEQRLQNEFLERAQSADASASKSIILSDASESARNTPELDGNPRSAEPRKRKYSDESQKSRTEPPRQRPRLSLSAKASPKLNSRGISPPSPSIPDLPTHRRHRRSGSLQSAATRSSNRKKRDSSAHSHASDDKTKWADDSSDDSSTTFSRPPALLPPRSNRISSRALASPARANSASSRRADKYGTTPLAKYCEKGQLDQVKLAYSQAPEELDQEDNGGFAPLQKAALRGHVEVVKFLLDKGCRRDCCSKEAKDTPLIDAVENGHVEVIRILLDHGVNPHHANKSGVRAIDAIDWEGDEAGEIEELLKKAMAGWQNSEPEPDESTQESPVISRRERGTGSLRPDLLYQAHTKETLLKYSTNGDIEAVGNFLESVVPDNACIVAAARGGHDSILSLLLASAPEVDKDPDPLKFKETPLLAAIGRSNLKVIRLLLEQDNFNPCRKTREGKTYFEVAEERRGPRWQAEVEILKEKYDAHKSVLLAKRKRIQEAKAAGKSTRDLSGPRSPKVTKTKPVRSEKANDEHKAKRLSGGNDMTTKEARRKRHVIDDESSQDGSADDANGPATRIIGRKRTNSAPSKVGTLEKEKSVQSQRKPSDDHKPKPGRKPRERKVIKSEVEDNDIEMEDPLAVAAATSSLPLDTLPAQGTKSTEVKPKTRKRAHSRLKAQNNRDEEAKRLKEDASSIREDEARRKQEEDAVSRAKEREELLSSVPDGIRDAMERGRDRSIGLVKYNESERNTYGIQRLFLPIPIPMFQRHEVDAGHFEAAFSSNTPGFSDEKWCLSFYAVGILGLQDLSLSDFPSWIKLPVSHEQRIMYLSHPSQFRINQIAFVRSPIPRGAIDHDPVAHQKHLDVATHKFLTMQPLWWIKLDDLLAAVGEREDLNGLKVTGRSDAAFRPPLPEFSWIESIAKKELEYIPKGSVPKQAGSTGGANGTTASEEHNVNGAVVSQLVVPGTEEIAINGDAFTVVATTET